jgi:hypothetical protein
MRYFLSVVILLVSLFTQGQNVFTKFDVLATYEEFEEINDNWDQRYSPTELITTQNNRYLLRRHANMAFSTSLPKNLKELNNAQVRISFLLPKKGPNSGGILLWANATGNAALFVEINEKGKMRVRKLSDNGQSIISGTKNDGWIKTKGFIKGHYNNMMIKAENGNFDIYLNDKFQRSFTDLQLQKGRIGLFVNASSQIEVDYFSVYSTTLAAPDAPKEDKKEDTSMDDVLVLFRNKIDAQQKDILKLQNELNACKASSGIDTAARKTNKELSLKNQELTKQLGAIEAELESKRKRLQYLESMKEDLEKSANGDLIISLTELLSKEKKELAAAKEDNTKKKLEIFTLQKQIEELRFKISQMEK